MKYFNRRDRLTKTTFFILCLLFLHILASSYAYCYESTMAKQVDDIGQEELNHSVAYYKLHVAKLDLEREHWASYVKHQEHLMQLKEDSYSIHCKMTTAILMLVSFLVIGGFYFAFLQFDKDKHAGNTTIKLSKDGIEINSSVIGLVVLFMSFLFFYLFIKDVYVIKTASAEQVSFHNQNSATKINKIEQVVKD